MKGYPGSKAQSGTWQRIIGQMPPHSVYIEPFFGSGQIFWRKRPADLTIIIDKNRAVITKARAAAARAGFNAGGPPWLWSFCDDALQMRDLLLSLPLDQRTLIYCDPPYLLSTRNGRRYYEHELTEDQHASLLALLQEMKCRVMLSGYPSALYSSQLQSWRCLEYEARTRGRTKTECLWLNFPEPDELHDWRFAGMDFRRRTELKRMAGRWRGKLEKMDARTRGYIQHALLGGQWPPTPVPALRTPTPFPTLRDPNVSSGVPRGNGRTTAPVLARTDR